MELVALATQQIVLLENAQGLQHQLRHELDDYRILVDVTNAVLSKLDLDDVMGEIWRKFTTFSTVTPSASCYAVITPSSSPSTLPTI